MKNYYLLCIVSAVVWTSCSTTKHIPRNEQLYTGIKKIEIIRGDASREGDEALSEIESALSYPPNNALFGSSSIRIPFPAGLWMYNAFVNKQGKLSRWLFKAFAAKPVFISTVNPEVRTGIAANLLHEHGYFNGSASYEVITSEKDSMKAKIIYRLTMNEPYRYDSIRYRRFLHRADMLIKQTENKKLLRKGDPFCVIRLEQERQRIATLMRDNGYYYFRPDYIVYEADSTLEPQKISLRMQMKEGIAPQALRPWQIGLVTVNLSDHAFSHLKDTLWYHGMAIVYDGKLKVRPNILYNQFRFKTGDVYSQTKQAQTQSNLAQLRTFQYTEMQFTPKDSSRRNNVLNVNVNTTYDLPLSGEVEVNITANSNQRIGPGAVLSVTKNNLFGGGEMLHIKMNGTYEWLYDNRKESGSSMDNYEYGLTASLVFPRILVPRFIKRTYDFPASTTFQLNANRQNRAEFFRMLSFGAGATYDFQPNRIRHHSVTPFSLTFNHLEKTTERFDMISQKNPALFQSLRDQFIPAISYTYTLDNSSIREGRHTTWWQLSVSEAGNLLSGIYALAGKSFHKEKKMLGNPFSQFLKLTTELRYNHVLDRNNRLVGRIGVGGIYSYGNMKAAPYTEQFFIGGANSIRAFAVRTIGPGRYQYDKKDRYATLDHIGDLKLEANLEYRFRLTGNLESAVFLDAGNVWMIRSDEETKRTGGQLKWKHFWNDIALGTGFGFRYNLDILVIRFDIGIGLHVPYETNKKGYYNLEKFSNGLGFHLAVGYPF
ncbi:MAG: BamA/TamA family outer membrane protein [Tannerella sp.]|jgi:outer membrane protein assembly factor BamA|nr:BamA/TamA family outer membrane protein [Tannerella sp.]